MKELIVIVGTIVLGSLLFTMMVGDQAGSLKSTASQAMRVTISQYAQP